LPPDQQAKSQATDEQVAQLLAALNTALADQGAGLTPTQQQRVKVVMAAAITDDEPPSARAGLRGFEPTADVLRRLGSQGPGWRWSVVERDDVASLQTAAAVFLATWGHPAEPCWASRCLRRPSGRYRPRWWTP
jgi:hypothetical protein